METTETTFKGLNNGLPVRTILANTKDGVLTEFSISTETVQEIMRPILDGTNFTEDEGGLVELCTKFDEKIMYYVPNGIFELEDTNGVVEFINNVIDDNWKFDVETKDDEEEYILSEDAINGVKINEKINEEELFEYRIIERESFIDDLIRWISEAKGNDKVLMRDDLEMLLKVEDEYIFSSIKTNEYIYVGCSEFNETCKGLLELNESIK